MGGLKKILITGGNGYIGKNLYNSLKNVYDVVTLSRDDFDLRDQFETIKYFSNKYFDTVIHCAVSGGSRLREDTISDMDNNLQMYYNLLNCKNKFSKLIHFGSGAELYFTNTPYGLSKHVISESILGQENFYNIRIFAVFDENELETRYIKTIIKKYIRHESIHIFANKKMDFFYMKDFISIIRYYIVNDNPPKSYDCVYSEKKTLLDIANIVNSLDSHSVEVHIDSNTSEDYIGEFVSLDIEYIGLKTSINDVYEKIKNDLQLN